jgi:hypothetical protein
MITAAEQERFVPLRIQAWKELFGWNAGAVYLCDVKPWGRSGKLQGQEEIFQR